jgi:hypothetical protein
MGTFNIDLRGLDRVRAKLQTTDTILSRPWQATMRQAGNILLEVIRPRAPGTLGDQFVMDLDPKPVPRFVRAKISPTPTRGGFRYPFALDSSKKRVFHYRVGSRAGRLTLGWLTEAKATVRRRVGGLLRATAAGIEQEWKR